LLINTHDQPSQVFILDWHAATANAGASITGASSVPVCWLSVGTALKPSKTSTTLGLALGDYGKRFKGKDYYIDIKSAAVRAAMIQASPQDLALPRPLQRVRAPTQTPPWRIGCSPCRQRRRFKLTALFTACRAPPLPR
jgi:hypothetical protein